MKLIDIDADKEYLLDGKYKVEPIVHCKDCINVCRVGNETQLLCQYLADRRGHYLNPNGYCSYGERKGRANGE